MMVMIQLTSDEELKALPLLLRHTSGRILRGRRYVIDESAAKMLKKAGIQFETLSPNGTTSRRPRSRRT
jgi:hypothetical protein